MEKRRILITGGSGFVGTNLVANFLQMGWEVLNLDIVSPRDPAHRLVWRLVNLLDRRGLIQAMCDFQPQVFLHFGARTDLDERVNLAGYAANIEGVCNVIDAIRAASSVERAIFASSQLVCRIGYQPKDEHDYQPSTLYGQSKVLTERIVRAAHDFGPAWTLVRPTSLWGPWFGIPYRNFFDAIRRGLYIHPGGIVTRKQWGFVGNSIYQVMRLLDAPVEEVHQRTFYLADYEPLVLSQFADLVQQALGAAPIRTFPYAGLQAAAAAGDVLKRLGWKIPPLSSFRLNNIITDELQDLEPLQEVVGPPPYTLEQGIEITVGWLKEHGMV